MEAAIERASWEGRVPVRIDMAPNELTSFESPQPLYVSPQCVYAEADLGYAAAAATNRLLYVPDPHHRAARPL